jgi:hypothetical protein
LVFDPLPPGLDPLPLLPHVSWIVELPEEAPLESRFEFMEHLLRLLKFDKPIKNAFETCARDEAGCSATLRLGTRASLQ